MISGDIEQAVTRLPSSSTVATRWCIDSINSMSKDIVKSAWRHGEYSYFPTESAAVVLNDEDGAVDGFLEDDNDNNEEEEYNA